MNDPTPMQQNDAPKMRVPYGRTVHGDEEINAVVNVLRTSTQMGQNVQNFESKIASLYAKKYGVMVNSGSSANYLAIELLNLPTGAEVITPTLTFATTVAPIVKCGLTPVFVDVEPDTFNIDVAQVENAISKNTRALMIPNLIGNFPDWDKLREIADRHGLFVVEDSADTLGALLRNRSTGERTDISTTSFYGSHVINCAGNGGMLCINDSELLKEAKLLRSWGRDSSLFDDSENIENRFNVDLEGVEYDAKFVFSRIGYNLEPSEIGAAFGLVQLEKLNDNISLRTKYYDQQCAFFSKYEDWFVLPRQIPDSVTGWLAFPLIVKPDAPFNRRQMQIFMEQAGIQTRVVFTGNILRQPGFKNIKRRELDGGYPNADRVMEGGILMACHHGLTSTELDYLHECFENFARQF